MGKITRMLTFLACVAVGAVISHKLSERADELALTYLKTIGRLTRHLTDPILRLSSSRTTANLAFYAISMIITAIIVVITGNPTLISSTVFLTVFGLSDILMQKYSLKVSLENWDELNPLVKQRVMEDWIGSPLIVLFIALFDFEYLAGLPIALIVGAAIPGFYLYPIPPKETVKQSVAVGAGGAA